MAKLTGMAQPKTKKLYVCEFHASNCYLIKSRVMYPSRPEEWYKTKSNIAHTCLFKVEACSDNEAWELILKKITEYGCRQSAPMGKSWMPWCRNGRDGSKLKPPMNTSYWDRRTAWNTAVTEAGK